MTVSWNFLF